jgi:hypothetical protein
MMGIGRVTGWLTPFRYEDELRLRPVVIAEGREASGVGVRDSMMGIGRVTGWLTPFRYEGKPRLTPGGGLGTGRFEARLCINYLGL